MSWYGGSWSQQHNMMGGCSVSKMGRLGAQCAIAWCLLSLTLVHARWLLRVNETFVVTQDVRQPVVLQAMLNTSVSTLMFELPEFVLVPEAWRFITKETPYMLDRPFMITSSGPSAPTLIDFQLLSQRVVLEPNINFTFSNVNLANIRMSNRLGMEWFMLSDGATVIMRDVVIVDVVCHDTASAALASAQSSPQLPGHPPNRVSITSNTCLFYQGQQRCFQDGLHYQSFAVVTAYEDAARGISQPGYTLVYDNVTHVCRSYLDQQCVQQHGANICWERQAQQLLPGLFGVTAATSSTDLSAGAIAGIAIAGGAALLAGALAFIYLRRRKAPKAADPMLKQPYSDTEGSSHGKHAPGVGSLAKLSARGSAESMVSGSMPSGTTAGISLGVLLGAGSFGRVYKARWHSNDVAVKVMTCRPSELAKIMKEAEIMMSMQHGSIVRALNCTVVQRKTAQAHEQALSATSQVGSSGKGQGSELTSLVSSNANKQLSSACQTASKDVSTASTNRLASGQGPLSTTLVGDNPPSGSCSTNTGSKPEQQTSADGKCLIVNQRSSSLPQDVELGAAGNPAGGEQASGSSDGLKGPVVPFPADSMTNGAAPGDEIKEADAVEVWLVMELCTGGTLKDACNVPRDKLDMARLVTRLMEVASGMSYLHDHNVLHSDLKAANILLKNTVHGSYGQQAKISDFGLSSQLLAGATHRSTRTTGTITHTAPEVLQTAKITPAADVYAFGIMMWELFTNKSAFQGTPYGSVALSVVQGERPPIPASMPESYQLLMCSCWAQNPLDRPDFDQVGKCLMLLLDNLETMDSPLTDPTYLAAVGDQEGEKADGDKADGDRAAGQQRQQQQQEYQPQQQGGSAASQATRTFSGSMGWDELPATPGRGSMDAQQQPGLVPHYTVRVSSQTTRPSTTVSSGRPSGLTTSSRHIQDL